MTHTLIHLLQPRQLWFQRISKLKIITFRRHNNYSRIIFLGELHKEFVFGVFGLVLRLGMRCTVWLRRWGLEWSISCIQSLYGYPNTKAFNRNWARKQKPDWCVRTKWWTPLICGKTGVHSTASSDVAFKRIGTSKSVLPRSQQVSTSRSRGVSNPRQVKHRERSHRRPDCRWNGWSQPKIWPTLERCFDGHDGHGSRAKTKFQKKEGPLAQDLHC